MNSPNSQNCHLNWELSRLQRWPPSLPRGIPFVALLNKMHILAKLTVYQHLNIQLTTPREICYFKDFQWSSFLYKHGPFEFIFYVYLDFSMLILQIRNQSINCHPCSDFLVTEHLFPKAVSFHHYNKTIKRVCPISSLISQNSYCCVCSLLTFSPDPNREKQTGIVLSPLQRDWYITQKLITHFFSSFEQFYR